MCFEKYLPHVARAGLTFYLIFLEGIWLQLPTPGIKVRRQWHPLIFDSRVCTNTQHTIRTTPARPVRLEKHEIERNKVLFNKKIEFIWELMCLYS